jgi:hypothetical protein
LRGTVRIGSRVAGGSDRNARGAKRGAFYAHMLEGGSQPHVIQPGWRLDQSSGFSWTKRRVLRIQGQYVAKVKHPGVRAYRMVADTFAQDTAEATRAFDAYVDAAIDYIVEQRAVPPSRRI